MHLEILYNFFKVAAANIVEGLYNGLKNKLLKENPFFILSNYFLLDNSTTTVKKAIIYLIFQVNSAQPNFLFSGL